MLNIDQSESINMENQKNEFLDDGLQYERCPFCQRTFFQGKLSYHLKLCSPDHPMFKTPLKSTRGTTLRDKQSPQSIQLKQKIPTITNYQRCQHCNTKLPIFLLEKHLKKCFQNRQDIVTSQQEIVLNTNIDFIKDKKSENILPRIRNSAQPSNQKIIEFSTYTVRIRQQLRCFRRALEVQTVTCPSCGRKFSDQASLRHIPICENLRQKQQKSIALTKKSKSLKKKKSDFFTDKKQGILDLKKIENIPITRKSKIIQIGQIQEVRESLHLE